MRPVADSSPLAAPPPAAPSGESEPVVSPPASDVISDAERLAVNRARLESAREAHIAEERLRAIRESNEAAERNAASYQRNLEQAKSSVGQLREEAARLAQTKIDPDRWWSDRSTGQKIAGFVAAAIGGLLQPYTGGRNRALDTLLGRIDADIQAQQSDMGREQALLGMQQGMVRELVAAGEEDAHRGAAPSGPDDRSREELRMVFRRMGGTPLLPRRANAGTDPRI